MKSIIERAQDKHMQTIDISTAQFKKTKKMESLLKRIKKYLDAMALAGKKPSSIDMAKQDYKDFLSKAKTTLPPRYGKMGSV